MNEIKDQSITTKALTFIHQYGNIHADIQYQQWLLDQVVRILCEDEETYNTWVNNYEYGLDGDKTYNWNVGVG